MDIVQLYNPANARNLTPDEIMAMKDLTDEQIGQLAEAYPNQPTGNAYLMYYDKSEKEDKQRFPLGTWKNLFILRTKLRKTEIIPFGFRASAPKYINTSKGAKPTGKIPAKSRVIDLSKDEKLEGFKSEEVKEEIVSVDNNAMSDGAQIAEFAAERVANDNTLLDAVIAAEAELAKAESEQAHHMTIKSLKNKLAEAKAAAGIE